MESRKRKVLLTGANGLLGQKLLKILVHEPGIELFASSKGENRNRIREGYTWLSLDITDFQGMSEAFALHAFTEVIHAAAMTNVDQCEKEKELCRKINVDAVKHLVSLCEASGTRLIHVSTDFIFDGSAGPYSEEASANPLSFYGQSKWDAELAVQSGKMPWAIVRTVLIYGLSEDMSRSNIVLWAKSSLEKGQSIRVVNDQFRTPTLAEDLADGIKRILMRDKTGIFNISGGEQMCILDLVRQVADFWKLDACLIGETDSASLGQPAKRPPVTGFIIDKARRELGYNPHSFKDGLALLDTQLKS